MSLLPPNRTKAEAAMARTADRLLEIPVPNASLWNPDTCPAAFLPWLAWSFSVDVWNNAWAEPTKRQVIRDAIGLHRIKGTRAAVETALKALEMDIDLVEWFELDELGAPVGPPGTFVLDAFAEDIFDAGFGIDPSLIALINRLVEDVKPVRAHYTLRIGEKRGAPVIVGTGSRQSAELRDAFSPALPVARHAPTLSARTGHRTHTLSRHDHIFTAEASA